MREAADLAMTSAAVVDAGVVDPVRMIDTNVVLL